MPASYTLELGTKFSAQVLN